MARTTEGFLPIGVSLSLFLDRYQEIMRLPISAFNGLNNPLELRRYACDTIWQQSQRDNVAQFLASAEEMREKELGYYLGPKYVEDERHELEHYPYNPHLLNHKHLIAIGSEAFSDISLGEALTLSNMGVIVDPVIIVVATTVTKPEEIVVCYPGESEYIHPSSVVIAGGNATIKIPRARLVDPTLNDDREDPLAYDDDNNFLDEVDIKRRYTDISKGVYFKYYDNSLVEQSHDGYGQVLYERIAAMDAYPVSWSGLTPTLDTVNPFCGCQVQYLKISYLSGIQYTVKMQLETARLAHTLMPYEPCSCDSVKQFWLADNNVTDGASMTPYGDKTGALNAWLTDSRSKIGFGGKFPRSR